MRNDALDVATTGHHVIRAVGFDAFRQTFQLRPDPCVAGLLIKVTSACNLRFS